MGSPREDFETMLDELKAIDPDGWKEMPTSRLVSKLVELIMSPAFIGLEFKPGDEDLVAKFELGSLMIEAELNARIPPRLVAADDANATDTKK